MKFQRPVFRGTQRHQYNGEIHCERERENEAIFPRVYGQEKHLTQEGSQPQEHGVDGQNPASLFIGRLVIDPGISNRHGGCDYCDVQMAVPVSRQ